MTLVVGWRLICHDCGSNCDLHYCFEDCNCPENLEGECTHEGMQLCGECIEKRENEDDNSTPI